MDKGASPHTTAKVRDCYLLVFAELSAMEFSNLCRGVGVGGLCQKMRNDIPCKHLPLEGE